MQPNSPTEYIKPVSEALRNKPKDVKLLSLFVIASQHRQVLLGSHLASIDTDYENTIREIEENSDVVIETYALASGETVFWLKAQYWAEAAKYLSGVH